MSSREIAQTLSFAAFWHVQRSFLPFFLSFFLLLRKLLCTKILPSRRSSSNATRDSAFANVYRARVSVFLCTVRDRVSHTQREPCVARKLMYTHVYNIYLYMYQTVISFFPYLEATSLQAVSTKRNSFEFQRIVLVPAIDRSPRLTGYDRAAISSVINFSLSP